MHSIRQIVYQFPREQKIRFFVRSCGNFLLVSPDREPVRHVDFGEIFWCIEGSAVFYYQGRKYLLKPAFVWYYPPGSTHDFHPVTKSFHYRWMSIEGPDAATFFDAMAISPGMRYCGACPEHLFSGVMLQIAKKKRAERLESLPTAVAILTQIVSCLKPDSPSGSIAENALRIIENNFSDPELSIQHVAELLQVHRVSLSRLFHSRYDMTIQHWLASCRLRHAMELLRRDARPIREIAAISGFGSVEYFTRAFRMNLGQTPAEFRRNHGESQTFPAD